MDTFRILIVIIATKGLEYYRVNIKNTFMELGLVEEIYLSAPLGVTMKKGWVLRVLYSLYGLKQIARD
jgi:hypothetical protein